MIELPSINLNTNEELEFHVNLHINELLKSVGIYILSKNLTSRFYNLSDFYFKNKIDNDEVKKRLKEVLVTKLKESEYILAYVFNDTGLVIVKSEEDIENSVWKSNLDYRRL